MRRAETAHCPELRLEVPVRLRSHDAYAVSAMDIKCAAKIAHAIDTKHNANTVHGFGTVHVSEIVRAIEVKPPWLRL